jgi:hypothetical protein
VIHPCSRQTARVIVKDKQSWSNDAWARAASLGPSDEAVVRAIGLNQDNILSSTPC